MIRHHSILVLVIALLATLQTTPVELNEVEGLRAEVAAAVELGDEVRAGAEAALEAALAAIEEREQVMERKATWQADADLAGDQLERRAETVEEPEPLRLELPEAPKLADFQAAMTRIQAELNVAREQLKALGTEELELNDRAALLPEELARARQDWTEAREKSEAASPESADLLARARALADRSQTDAQAERVATLEAEQNFVAARSALLPLLQDGAQTQVEIHETALASLQSRVEEVRQDEAERLAKEALRLRIETARRYPVLAKLAMYNEEVAAKNADMVERLERLQATEPLPESNDQSESDDQLVERGLPVLKSDLSELRERSRTTREKVLRASLAGTLGVILQRQLESLPAPGGLRRQARDLRRQLAEDQLLQIEMSEDVDWLSKSDVALDKVIADLRAASVEVDESLRGIANDILEQRLATVGPLSEIAQELVDSETEYVLLLDQLAQEAEEFRAFIAERILWVRAPARERVPSGQDVTQTLAWALAPGSWSKAWSNGLTAAAGRPLVPGLFALTAVALLARRRAHRRGLVNLAEQARSFRTDGFGLTLRALLSTALLAAPVPVLLLLASWLLRTPTGQPGVAVALGDSLLRIALLTYALSFLRVLVLPKGLGDAHLRWSGAATRKLRIHLVWFVPAALALATLARTLGHSSAAEFAPALARYALAAGLLVFLTFNAWVLHPRGALFAESFKRSPGSLLERSAWLWYGAATFIPFAIAAMAVLGYGYGAQELARILGNSCLLLIVVITVYGLLLRWLYVERRRLLVGQARQRARARMEEADDPSASVFNEDEVDVASVDQQTRRLFRTGSLGIFALGLYLIWAGALPALHVLDRVQLWPEMRIMNEAETAQAINPIVVTAHDLDQVTEGRDEVGSGATSSIVESAPPESPRTVITLLNVLAAALLLLLMTIAARNLPGLLEIALLKRLPVDAGSRYAIGALVRYLIIMIGSTAALGAIGIGWKNVQWLVAALTFGLGFGLQEIFANFVSGLIILIERPVRIGDVVTVAGVEGRVTQIHMRSTTITDWDRRELLVPNREFITSSLINWTLSDPITRIVLPVGIAYGSDTKKARSLLMKCAVESEIVLTEPAPSAIFRSFGDSSLVFELRVFSANRDLWPVIVDSLHQSIDDAFREAGIEIAFPQMDLHVRSIGPLADALGARASAPS